MKSHADRQASELLRSLATQMRKVKTGGSEDSVHDLRTSIRRLSECLRVFEMFFPDGEARRLRQKLKKMTDLAGAVRNRDIAAKLFEKGGMAADEPAALKLSRQRATAVEELVTGLGEDFPRRCRAKLNLG